MHQTTVHSRQAGVASTSAASVVVFRAPRLASNVRRSRQPHAGRVAFAVKEAVPVGVVEERAELEQLLPLPRQLESPADDPNLHNPLQRMERLGTGWFGVITDYEGVVVEDTLDAHARAWLQVAEDMNLARPLGQTLMRIKGVRDEAVIMQLFNWTRNPSYASKIAWRKEELYDEIMNGVQPSEVPGCRAFLDTLRNYKVPIALATAAPERRVRPALSSLQLDPLFDAVVTAEDNGSAETEYYYMLAANQIQRPFVRCIVVSDSNRSVEAAHELGMKSVVVTGGQPSWNFGSADLVVRSLSDLRVVNLKKLIGNEELVEREEDPLGVLEDGEGAGEAEPWL